MTISFSDLITPQTVESVRQSVISAAGIVNWAVTSLPPLARLRKLALDVVPVVVWAATEVHTEAIRGGLLDFARGIWLDAICENLFDVERIQQTFATVEITFTNTGPNNYAFAAGEVTVSNGVATYTNLEPFTLAVGPSTATADVICTEIGSAGNADANTITTMVTTFDGVTCTNVSVARGTDYEEDEALRARARASRGALSKAGGVDAYRFVALAAQRTDGTAIGITRVQVVEHEPSLGDVTVYLADADGPPANADVTRVDELIRAQVVPSGVNYLGTFAATPVTVAVEYQAVARASDGLTDAEIEAIVEEALDELFASAVSNPIGGNITPSSTPDGVLFRSEIQAVISQAQATPDDPRPIVDVTLVAPAANVTLSPGEVAVRGAISSAVTLI